MGRTQLPISTIAIAMGHNVRVGMEDNVFYRYKSWSKKTPSSLSEQFASPESYRLSQPARTRFGKRWGYAVGPQARYHGTGGKRSACYVRKATNCLLL